MLRLFFCASPVLVVLLLNATSAGASRSATGDELRATQRAALKSCRRQDDGCKRKPVKISTVSSRRYAFGGAGGMSFYNGALMRRSNSRWRVLAIQGGGAVACSYWYRQAPRRVVRDLRLSGLDDNTAYGRC